MQKPDSFEKARSSRKPSTNNTSRSTNTPASVDDGPALTPHGIARSEFGRFYWSGRAELSLRHQQDDAAARLAQARRGWQEAMRKRLAEQSKEWRRRRKNARHAKALQDAVAAAVEADKDEV